MKAYGPHDQSSRPTDADFETQLSALSELAAIEEQLRWLDPESVAVQLLRGRARALMRQIEEWDRRFAGD
jgi:hypothetical protein